MRARRTQPTRSHFRRAANVRFRVGARLAGLRWGPSALESPRRRGCVLRAASALPEPQNASRPHSLPLGASGGPPRGGNKLDPDPGVGAVPECRGTPGGGCPIGLGVWSRPPRPEPSYHSSLGRSLPAIRGWSPPLFDSSGKDAAPGRARGSGILIAVSAPQDLKHLSELCGWSFALAT